MSKRNIRAVIAVKELINAYQTSMDDAERDKIADVIDLLIVANGLEAEIDPVWISAS